MFEYVSPPELSACLPKGTIAALMSQWPGTLVSEAPGGDMRAGGQYQGNVVAFLLRDNASAHIVLASCRERCNDLSVRLWKRYCQVSIGLESLLWEVL